MKQPSKPRIGVLALMLPDYEALFPGITRRQEAFVEKLLETHAAIADFRFEGAALGRASIEEKMLSLRAQGCDGVMILPLTYSQGQYLVRAAMEAHLPLALVLVQPDDTAHRRFEEIDLTVNQAIHGTQDQANCLKRAGIPYEVYAGDKGDELACFLSHFAAAAATVTALRKMRIGVVGKLPGMGDVITDDMAFYRTIGPEFVYDSIGNIWRHTQVVQEQDIRTVMARDRELFDIDTRLSDAQLGEALRMYLGIKAWLTSENYDGYTVQFSEFGADGRFKQLPLLAASHLMADGYGYAAEGDASAAALLAAMHRLCGPANFTEMYMMDFHRDALLFCHAGEGNWRVVRQDKRPRIIDRPLSEGGLDNPPTPIFAPVTGRATVMSLIHREGNRFCLLSANGQVLADDDLERCEMPYMFFRPDAGVAPCASAWLREGGTHHEVVVFGEHTERIAMFCRMLGIEHLSI